MPIMRRIPSSSRLIRRARRATRQPRIRALSAIGRVAEAANYKHELAAQRTRTACPHFHAPGASVPDGRAKRLVLDERSWALAPDIFILVTNPIESAFATVRHRAVRMKGALSQHTARLMVFKLVIAASESWRRLQGQNQLPKVVSGATFRDGIEVASEKKSAA